MTIEELGLLKSAYQQSESEGDKIESARLKKEYDAARMSHPGLPKDIEQASPGDL